MIVPWLGMKGGILEKKTTWLNVGCSCLGSGRLVVIVWYSLIAFCFSLCLQFFVISVAIYETSIYFTTFSSYLLFKLFYLRQCNAIGRDGKSRWKLIKHSDVQMMAETQVFSKEQMVCWLTMKKNEKILNDVVQAATYLSFQLLDLIFGLLCSHNQLGKQNRVQIAETHWSVNVMTQDPGQTHVTLGSYGINQKLTAYKPFVQVLIKPGIFT